MFLKKIRESKSFKLDEVVNKLADLTSDLTILNEIYINAHTDLTIKCNNNHIFKRSWNTLKKNPKCSICYPWQSKIMYDIDSAELYEEDWKRINAIVYTVKCYNDFESFYKIGITTRQVKQRFYAIPYRYGILYEIKTNLYESIYIEHELLHYHSEHRYSQKERFGGETECFSKIIYDIIDDYDLYYNYNSISNDKYKTNCHLCYGGHYYNISIIKSKNILMKLACVLNAFVVSAQDLNISIEPYAISGYTHDKWVNDLKIRLNELDRA